MGMGWVWVKKIEPTEKPIPINIDMGFSGYKYRSTVENPWVTYAIHYKLSIID
jgi:hypothetical protein